MIAGSRILVIDDSTTLRKLVEIAMRGTGCEVDFAANGSDGLALARTSRPDVILLDYLLPDLQSAEVCRRLSDDQATARVPVVVMSANQRSVLEDFRAFAAVVDFVGKPFTPVEIRARLASAIQAAPRGRRASTPPATQPITRQDATARAIAEVLADGLASIPGLAAPDGSDPAAHHAARLCTPEWLSELTAACTARTDDDQGLVLRGDLMATPPLEMLRLLSAAGATGVLVVELGDVTRVFLRRGEVVMCASTRLDVEPGTIVPPELAARIRRDQATGKPALVTLAEAGLVRATDLPLQIHVRGARLLRELLQSRAGRFAWRPALALPDFVEAFGRTLSVTSIALEHRRRAAGSASAPAVYLDDVYDRTPGFSAKLSGARLDTDEQRVLALVDGQHTVREIVARTELSIERTAAVLTRLREVGLVRDDRISGVSEAAGGLAVLDPDRDEFSAALRAHLQRRAQPVDVIDLDGAYPLAPAVIKLRPRAVLLNAALLTPQIVGHDLPVLARDGTIALVAVLDAPDSAEAQRMLATGLHVVLTKPIHVSDVDRLLLS